MAAAVDGTIRIDTKLDAGGFNKGTTSMSAGFSKLGQTIKKSDITVKKTVDNISSGFSKIGQSLKAFGKALSIGALLIFGVALKQIFGSIRESVMNLINVNMKGSQLGKDVEGIKNQFTELKSSIAAAFLPLIQAAVPYIKVALSWLIEFFNRVAMITAAFLGQKEVLQIISGSAAELAQNTEDAEKAALGALAAFDQINVLNKPETAADVSPSELPQVMTQLIPVTDDILEKVQNIKDIIASWWNDPIGMIMETWRNIAAWFKTNVIDPIREWWMGTWIGQEIAKVWEIVRDNFIAPLALGFFVFVENAKKLFGDLWAVITDDSLTVPEKIKEIWNILVEFFKVNVIDILLFRFEKLKEDISNLWLALEEYVKSVWSNIVEWFKTNVLNPLRDGFITVWDGLKAKAISAKDAITSAWLGIVNWFKTTILDPLKQGFSNALDFISDNFSNIFTGIENIVRGIINNIINFINSMIDSIVGGINAVIDAANSIGNIIPGYNPIGNVAPPQIPGLATGAIIPPNAAFAAILGDQKSGRNIEAPEGLIRQIIREELGSIGGQKVTIEFTGSMAQFVRELHPLIKQESARVGGSLVKSGVTTT